MNFLKSDNFKFPEAENHVLKFWKENDIFKKSLDKNKRRKPFRFYEGPPTANGRPGIHHVLVRSFKDIICRFKTMQGFYVERKAGWDTHGLPVEIEVERELGLKTKKDIEKYGIAKFNEKCKASVWKYKDEWEKLTERIGFWLDLENPYITYQTPYIESLWWIIKELYGRKLFYKGYKVVPWCTRCGTALSSHEMAQGYKEINDRSVYVKFPITTKGKQWEKTAILSWTTTPWTLPGNVGLAINPRHTFVRVPDPNRVGYRMLLEIESFKRLVRAGTFGKEYIKKFPSKMSDWPKKEYKCIEAKKLVGLSYEQLFDVRALQSKKSFVVHSASFVTTTDGTGVVHTAVMYGEDDYQLGVKAGLPTVHTVNETGVFIKEVPELGGFRAKSGKGDDKIFQYLDKKKFLLTTENYRHEYPHCWRCATPLLYYARDSWFIKVSKLRKELLANNKKISWTPEHIKNGRFGEWLKDVKDWNFSRERYWGTPLPVWECKECQRTEVLASRDEIAAKTGKSKNTYISMRHGLAENNLKYVGASREKGKKFHETLTGLVQAKKSAEKLLRQYGKPDMIIASNLTRTQETAQEVARVLGIKKVVTDKRLREIDVGIFDGGDAGKYLDYYSNHLEKFTKRPPEGESLSDVRIRTVDLLCELEKKYSGKKILLVSHEYTIWAMYGGALGLSNEETAALRVGAREDDFVTYAEVLPIEFRKLPRDESGTTNLHRPYIDDMKFPCKKCSGDMVRIKELADVWFDSGAMPFAQAHWPFAQQKPKEKAPKIERINFPADYICEGVDQTRGWFYTLLAVSTLLGYGPAYCGAISLGHILDKKGEKMSKSKGNTVDPWELIEKYGVDTIRWHFYTVNHPGEPKRFDEVNLAKTLRRHFLTLFNTYVFYDTYADKKKMGVKSESKNPLDVWVLSRMNEVIHEVTMLLEEREVGRAAKLIEDLVNDVSRWYLRRSRRRLQKPDSREDYLDASRTLRSVLYNIAVISAPFTPFFSESLYQELREDMGESDEREQSVHLVDWPKVRAGSIDRKIIKDMKYVREVATEALKVRSDAGIKVRQPLSELRIKNVKLSVSEDLLAILADEINVKGIVFDRGLKEPFELDTKITPELKEEGIIRDLVRLTQGLRSDAGYTHKDEMSVLIKTDRRLQYIIERYSAYYRKEVGAYRVEFSWRGGVDAKGRFALDGEEISIGIKKR